MKIIVHELISKKLIYIPDFYCVFPVFICRAGLGKKIEILNNRLFQYFWPYFQLAYLI